MKTILNLENDHLSFTLHADASSRIVVKETGVIWKQWPVAVQSGDDFDQNLGWVAHHRPSFTLYPGRFALHREGEDIVARMTGSPGRRCRGAIRCRYSLEGPWLEVRITDIEPQLPSLVYPPPIESDAVLIPGPDRLIREHCQAAGPAEEEMLRASKWEWNFYRNPSWKMRWFGGLRAPDEQHGWIAIVSDGYEDAGVLSSSVAAAPVWMRSLDTWNTRRVVRYGFTDNGFVGLARRFRTWAQEDGLWGVPLSEKLALRPQLDCLLGGRQIRMTLANRREPRRYEDLWQAVPPGLPPEGRLVIKNDFREARRLADVIKVAGLKKGIFKYGGWGKGGYDERHPDIWPPEEALGTLEDFQALCGETPPYICCLHDNYYDVYEHSPGFPDGVCLDRSGQPMRVGYWSGGQAYPANTRDMFPHAAANARRIYEAGCLNHYFDTMAFLSQSFEPGNTLTRTEDREWKNRIFDASRELGMVVGSESGCDFYVAHTDWSPTGGHGLTDGQLPLWSLVFHDAHVGMRAISAGGAQDDPSTILQKTRRKAIENLLFGFGTVFVINDFSEWELRRESFDATWFADRWHESIASEEMIDHQLLSGDGALRRSVFSSGRAVTANLADSQREGNGVSLEGLEYRME